MFREIMLAPFLIVLLTWMWRASKGVSTGWLRWVIALAIIALVAIFGPMVYLHKAQAEKQASQMIKEWKFIWQMIPGHTSAGGSNSLALDVEITKNDKDSFWAVLHDRDGQGIDVSVGGLRLSKVDGNLIGEWFNYLDGDGGKCYLYKAQSGWSGHIELMDGRRPDCRLEEREVSKPDNSSITIEG